MAKGFAKTPKKYSPNGCWFSSYNWENGFYGTLDECLDRIQHCFSDCKFRLSGLLVSNAKADQTISAELLSAFDKTEEEIKRQEQQYIAQIRAQVRDKCLRDGVSEGKFIGQTPWYISFRGKGGKDAK
jgi:hypothetical protein